MNYLTVEQLEDVVQSQLCVHGDRAIFLQSSDSDQPNDVAISLFANDQLILDSIPQSHLHSDQSSLEVVAKRLEHLEPDTILEYSRNSNTNLVFELGFMAEARFTQVACSEELKPTIETVAYDKCGRMLYHPDFHGKQGQPWKTVDQQFLIDNYVSMGPEKVSLAVERTIHTVMNRAYILRKKGLMDSPAKRVYHRRAQWCS